RTIVPAKVIAGAKKILDELQVKALIIVGGDGSMVTAQQLQEAGINCIGVPKTIDNDLEATATTFGFDSAVDVVMDALDRVHTTATSHRRVLVESARSWRARSPDAPARKRVAASLAICSVAVRLRPSIGFWVRASA